MKKKQVILGISKIPIDFFLVFGSFFIAKKLREIGDFVPFVELPKQFISNNEMFLFAVIGALILNITFAIHSLYRLEITNSKSKEILDIIWYSIYSMMFFGIFVFLGRGFLYNEDLPRLIIFQAFFLSTIGIGFSRFFISKLENILLDKGVLEKINVVIISNSQNIDTILEDIKKSNVYNIVGYLNKEKLVLNLEFLGEKLNKEIVDSLKIEELFYISSDYSNKELSELWDISRILGLKYKYLANSFDITKVNSKLGLIHEIPVIEILNSNLSEWGKIQKRIFDIFASIFGIIIFSIPMLIIACLIKLEEKDGPVIYKNRRVGKNGQEFNLYKFRYIKWSLSIKDAYGIDATNDEALKIEKELIEKYSTRQGPLYKIENDPRKTKIGTFIEKYSLDELPQFFNVLKGEMSLVGPRPHQPREVSNYTFRQTRVLTIKPGITGMAQVNGRQNLSFDDEVDLDINYIESWSFLLDIKIIMKTFLKFKK